MDLIYIGLFFIIILKFFMSFLLYGLNLVFELNTLVNCNMKIEIEL
jgi:hypothetical protein